MWVYEPPNGFNNYILTWIIFSNCLIGEIQLTVRFNKGQGNVSTIELNFKAYASTCSIIAERHARVINLIINRFQV